MWVNLVTLASLAYTNLNSVSWIVDVAQRRQSGDPETHKFRKHAISGDDQNLANELGEIRILRRHSGQLARCA